MIIAISGKKEHGKDLTCSIMQWLITRRLNSGYIDIIPLQNFREREESLRARASGWQRKYFAEPLKNIVCILIGCTRQQLEDPIFKETPLGEEWTVWWLADSKDKTYKLSELYASLPKLKEIVNPIQQQEIDRLNIFVHAEILTPRKLLQLLGTECGRQIIHPNIWINALMKDYKPTTAHFTNDDYPNWIITDVRFPNEVQAVRDRGGILVRVNRFGMNDTSTHESETALDNYKDFDAVFENNSDYDGLTKQIETFLKHKNII